MLRRGRRGFGDGGAGAACVHPGMILGNKEGQDGREPNSWRRNRHAWDDESVQTGFIYTLKEKQYIVLSTAVSKCVRLVININVARSIPQLRKDLCHELSMIVIFALQFLNARTSVKCLKVAVGLDVVRWQPSSDGLSRVTFKIQRSTSHETIRKTRE